MNRRNFIKVGGAALSAIAQRGSLLSRETTEKPDLKRPNIIVIMADDLGYGDLSCYGAQKVQTPCIDGLAREGIQFLDAHAPSAVCTPSRYSALTGRYCWRTPLKVDCVFGYDPLLIEEGRLTSAAMLKSIGYSTAVIGKWHLGFGKDHPDWNGELKPGPLEVGFDHYFGYPITNSQTPHVYIENHRVVGLDPQDPIRLGPETKTNAQYGGKAATYKADEMTLTLTGKVVDYIEHNSDRPFFIHYAPPTVHSPYTPNPRFHGTSQCGVYGDFIRELDWSVGEIVAALKRTGVADDTLVIVTTDHGGLYSRTAYELGHRVNGVLLGQKEDLWEGGHRIPFVARWPKRIKAGQRSNELISTIDLMATMAAITGFDLPRDAAPDSFNVLPALLGNTSGVPVRGGALILESATGMLGVREGDWMLILGRGSGGATTEYARHYGMRLEELGRTTTGWAVKGMGEPDPRLPPGQLYNLAKDLGEAENVYTQHPEIVERLKNILVDYRTTGRSRA